MSEFMGVTRQLPSSCVGRVLLARRLEPGFGAGAHSKTVRACIDRVDRRSSRSPSSRRMVMSRGVGGDEHAAQAAPGAVGARGPSPRPSAPTAPAKCSGVRSGRSTPGLLTSSVYGPETSVELLEARADGRGDAAVEGVEVDAAGAVDDEADGARPPTHEVEDLEVERRERPARPRSRSSPADRAPRSPPPRAPRDQSKKERGHRPTLAWPTKTGPTRPTRTRRVYQIGSSSATIRARPGRRIAAMSTPANAARDGRAAVSCRRPRASSGDGRPRAARRCTSAAPGRGASAGTGRCGGTGRPAGARRRPRRRARCAAAPSDMSFFAFQRLGAPGMRARPPRPAPRRRPTPATGALRARPCGTAASSSTSSVRRGAREAARDADVVERRRRRRRGRGGANRRPCRPCACGTRRRRSRRCAGA